MFSSDVKASAALGWRPNAIGTWNDRKLASWFAQSEVSNRMGSAACPQ
jgi:hypothetical protein